MTGVIIILWMLWYGCTIMSVSNCIYIYFFFFFLWATSILSKYKTASKLHISLGLIGVGLKLTGKHTLQQIFLWPGFRWGRHTAPAVRGAAWQHRIAAWCLPGPIGRWVWGADIAPPARGQPRSNHHQLFAAAAAGWSGATGQKKVLISYWTQWHSISQIAG